MVWHGICKVWYGMVWYMYGMVWYGIYIRYGMVWDMSGMVWYGIYIRYGMVWYNHVRYDMVWLPLKNIPVPVPCNRPLARLYLVVLVWLGAISDSLTLTLKGETKKWCKPESALLWILLFTWGTVFGSDYYCGCPPPAMCSKNFNIDHS